MTPGLFVPRRRGSRSTRPRINWPDTLGFIQHSTGTVRPHQHRRCVRHPARHPAHLWRADADPRHAGRAGLARPAGAGRLHLCPGLNLRTTHLHLAGRQHAAGAPHRHPGHLPAGVAPGTGTTGPGRAILPHLPARRDRPGWRKRLCGLTSGGRSRENCIFHTLYKRARYDLSLDYSRPPVPPLREHAPGAQQIRIGLSADSADGEEKICQLTSPPPYGIMLLVMIHHLFALVSDCLETRPAPRVRRKLVRVC